MVEVQLQARGIVDDRVLDAMRAVPRHMFVPEELRDQAYDDCPLPLGPDQTISQPLIVAEMAQLLQLEPSDTVLEIGTGSGYQSAVLSHLCAEVYTVEIDELLHRWASIVLERLNIRNVFCRHDNGYLGWPEKAPFDGIVISASCPKVPDKLLEQLREDGRCVFPFGCEHQTLILMEKTLSGMRMSEHGGVRFVMMKE